MPLQSQDPDARFSIFLNPIRDLTKNWEVDIAKYLEEYLEELAEIQITFDGGETLMNFAEAAMLIQGSAAVYSKKVEFLWQMVLQMLDLLSSKRSFESRADDEPLSNTQRSNKGNAHGTSYQFKMNENLSNGRNVNMRDEDDDEELVEAIRRDNFRFLPAMPLHLVEKEGEKSGIRIKLFLKNEPSESFADKDDHRINRSYLTPQGCLCLEIPQEILKNGVSNHIIAPLNSKDSIAGFLVPENYDLQPQFTEFRPPEDQEEFPLTPPQTDESPEDPADVDSPPEDIPDLPIDVPELENPEPGSDVIEERHHEIGRTNLRKRPAPKVVDIPLKDPWKPLDPHAEVSKRPIRAGRIKKPLSCSCHRERNKPKRKSKKNQSEEQGSRNKSLNVIPSVEDFITKQLMDKVALNNNHLKNKMPFDSIFKEELSKEETNRQEMVVLQKTEDTKVIQEKQDDLEEPHHLDDASQSPDLNYEEFGDQEFNLPAPHDKEMGGIFSIPLNSSYKELNDSLQYEPTSDYEALVQQWVSDYVMSAQEHIVSSELTKRVNKWKKNIAPKLELEEQRRAFDIHSYGSHIISFFPSDDDRPIPFETIAQNEDPNEVARLFLSSLMLANTYNLELTQTREGDLEMDCLQLRLLSRERHHKKLEEYAAPSQAMSPKRRKIKDKRKKRVGDDEEDEYEPLRELSVDSISDMENVGHKRPKTKDVTNR